MKLRKIDWSPVDWLDGVATMPPDERGVYDTIINLTYASGDPDGCIEMSEHDLALRCCCHWRELRRILAALLTRGKVVQDGRKIYPKRCADELHRAGRRIAQARQNGAKGGRPKGLAKPDGFPPANPEKHRARESTINHQEDSDISGEISAPADPIALLWDRGKKLLAAAGIPEKRLGPLVGSWRREFGDVSVMAAFDAADRELPSEPVSFIIGCLNNSKTRRGGNGRITEASERFFRGRQATLDAVLAAEERDGDGPHREQTRDRS
jgi:hypothetical protein